MVLLYFYFKKNTFNNTNVKKKSKKNGKTKVKQQIKKSNKNKSQKV
jgi:hypothetical protein